MIKEKISSQEIIDLVASKASVSKRAAEEFLKVMIATVEEALLGGDVVKIKNFGTFKLQWNESRKSVNVQTGEEITLTGYYKVVFTPDATLRVQVNEPFAHLEPVELEGKSLKTEPLDENEEVPLDPLRIFTEQASEIKNLISEIQALSINSKVSLSEEKKTSEIVKENVNQEEIISNVSESQLNKDESLFKVENDPIITENVQSKSFVEIDGIKEEEQITTKIESFQIESELPVTPYLKDFVSPKKNKVWLWLVILLFLMTGLGTGVCFTYPPATEYAKMISAKFSDTGFYYYLSNLFSPSVKKVAIPETVVIPKDRIDFDSINQNQPVVDSLQVLFDNPRIYNEFIATERIKEGSRLTIMSKRYYGSKEYWVYIYEANKEQISNPDNIAKGTIIKIPKLDPRLIDPANPRCLKKALELHDIYIK